MGVGRAPATAAGGFFPRRSRGGLRARPASSFPASRDRARTGASSHAISSRRNRAGGSALRRRPPAAPTAAPPPALAPSDEAIRALYEPGAYEFVPHDQMRRIIAQRLVAREADDSAFLPHRHLHHRRPAARARRDQRRRAQGQGRQARLEALGQRLRHQGARARADARAGGERHLDRGRHAQAQARRCGRRGRHSRRADDADRAASGHEGAFGDLGRDQGFRRPRAQSPAEARGVSGRRDASSPISACTGSRSSPP